MEDVLGIPRTAGTERGLRRCSVCLPSTRISSELQKGHHTQEPAPNIPSPSGVPSAGQAGDRDWGCGVSRGVG